MQARIPPDRAVRQPEPFPCEIGAGLHRFDEHANFHPLNSALAAASEALLMVRRRELITLLGAAAAWPLGLPIAKFLTAIIRRMKLMVPVSMTVLLSVPAVRPAALSHIMCAAA
jgi:hypothetical protein